MTASPDSGWPDELAERLAVLVLRRTQVPLAIPVLRAEIRQHLARIALAPSGGGELRAVSGTFGAWLAEIGVSGEGAVRSVLDTLGGALLGLGPVPPPGDAASALPAPSAPLSPVDGVEVLAAVAAGYAEGIRQVTFAQQENIKRAMVVARTEVERELHVSETRFGAVFASAAVGIAISDLDGVLVQGNPALQRICGRPEPELRGRSIFELFTPEHAAGLRADYRSLITADPAHSRFSRNTEVVLPDQDTNWVELSVALLRDQSGAADQIATIFADVTDLYLLTQRLRQQTLHDVVTTRPNRQYLVSRLEQVLGVDPDGHWLFHLDLDDFATPNHRFGRTTGDQLLRVVADRLDTFTVGTHDMLARADGDQFLLLVRRTGPDPEELAARICAAIQEPVRIEDDTVRVTASVGIAEPTPGVEPEVLLGQADQALRAAKRGGGGGCVRFSPDLDGQPG